MDPISCLQPSGHGRADVDGFEKRDDAEAVQVQREVQAADAEQCLDKTASQLARYTDSAAGERGHTTRRGRRVLSIESATAHLLNGLLHRNS